MSGPVLHSLPLTATFTGPPWSPVLYDTEDGSVHFLGSKEGMTQGRGLAMIAYGIGVLSFIRDIREAHTRVTHPWCADYAKVWVTCERILDHFQDMQARGSPRGYLP